MMKAEETPFVKSGVMRSVSMAVSSKSSTKKNPKKFPHQQHKRSLSESMVEKIMKDDELKASLEEAEGPRGLKSKCRRATQYLEEIMATSVELEEEEERQQRTSLASVRNSEGADSILEPFRSDVAKIDQLVEYCSKRPVSANVFRRNEISRKLDSAMNNMKGALGVLRILQKLEHCPQDQRPSLAAQLATQCANDARRCLAARHAGAVRILLRLLLEEDNDSSHQATGFLFYLETVHIIIRVTAQTKETRSAYLLALDEVVEAPGGDICKKLVDFVRLAQSEASSSDHKDTTHNSDHEIQNNKTTALHAASILRHLAGARPRYADLVVNAGAISPLCLMLDDYLSQAGQIAAKALWNICHNGGQQYRSAVRSRHAVPRLTGLIQHNRQESTVAALGCLANLALDHEAKTDITICKHLNGLPLLKQVMNILGTKDKEDSAFSFGNWSTRVKIQAATLLCNLQIDSDHHRIVVARRGGVDALVFTLSNSVHKFQVEEQQLKEVTACALQQLALNYQSKVAIAKAGGITPLIQLIANHHNGQNSERVQSAAALALMTLAHDNVKNEFDIGSFQGIHVLTRLLRRAVSEEAKEAAAGILCRLASDPMNRDRMARHAIPGLVKVLHTAETDPPITAAATCLWKISLQEHYIPDIIKAGAVRAIDECAAPAAQHASAGVLKELTGFPSAQKIIMNFWNLSVLVPHTRRIERTLDTTIDERIGKVQPPPLDDEVNDPQSPSSF